MAKHATRNDLRPYLSAVLVETARGVPTEKAWSAILGFLDARVTTKGSVVVVAPKPPVDQDGMRDSFLVYREDPVPAWIRLRPGVDVPFKDIVHGLVVIAERKDIFAVCFSDAGWRTAFVRSLPGKDLSPVVRPIPAPRLNALFVRDNTRTLWLAGAHRRTSIKADGKILSGADLRDALNPLDDQTYYFTSVRSHIPAVADAVGLTPRESRIWTGVSRDWEEFRGSLLKLLKQFDSKAADNPTPIAILAEPVTHYTDLGSVCEVAFVGPETEDGGATSAAASQVELWTHRSHLDIVRSTRASATLAVTLNQEALGTIDVTIDFTAVAPTLRVENSVPATGHASDLKEAADLIGQKDRVKVWFDSGHTLAHGEVFRMRFRDRPFRGFVWCDFKGVDVTEEKPTPLEDMGKQRSLFCWVVNNWPINRPRKGERGWLVCDDGAGEKADFIHFDPSVSPPSITLIHVKGAKSGKPTRGLSVAPFEVVTSQAIKNLRYLDSENLVAALLAQLDRKIAIHTWHNGKRSTRTAFINALKKSTVLVPRVVVLQPHLMMSHLASKALSAQSGLLHTLLLSAEAGCRSLGAEFSVIGST
jgi:hypothetical protein